MKFANRSGFTLAELLTVIAIITIIGGFSLTTISQARSRTRDDQRIRDLKTIQTALELYRSDLDRSTDLASDANRYAYPIRNLSAQPGIYGDTLFNKYLTKTPVDPLRKTNYAYFAPACLRPATSGQSVIISPAKDARFHTVKEIKDQSTLGALDPARYCPQGSGWLPYALGVSLERARTVEAQASISGNLANHPSTVVFSVIKPIFVLESEATEPNFTVIAGQSVCNPTTVSCPNGF